MDIPDWAAEAIIGAGQRMDAHHWVPATSGNLSLRIAPDRIAITCSGGHKGFLRPDQLMQLQLDGTPVGPGKPSAEAALHCQLYRHDAAIGAVLHGHSLPATVLSLAERGTAIRFRDHEIQKALAGQTTHDAEIALPILDNDQDIPRLAARAAPVIAGNPPGYLIRGHGVYVWGPDMPTAMARLEGLEFLIACAWETRKLGERA